MKWSELKKKLAKAGFSLDRQGKGSHEVWQNPVTGVKIVISSHGSKEVGTGLVNKIMKEAGLK